MDNDPVVYVRKCSSFLDILEKKTILARLEIVGWEGKHVVLSCMPIQLKSLQGSNVRCQRGHKQDLYR